MLIVNLLAALNFANVSLKIKNVKKNFKNVTKIKKNIKKTFFTSMVEPRPSAHDMTLPAFVPKRGGHMQQMSIDSWYAATHGAQQQTSRCRCCCPPTAHKDGQTDGQTPDRYKDPAAHTIRSSVSNHK